MKLIIPALALLLAVPAFAQPASQATPSEQATELMLNREMVAHKADLEAALQLQKQVADLTKQIADLKAKPAPVAAPAPTEPPKAN